MTSQSKVALVTGASRGIGAAIADTLGAAGIKVIGTATSIEGAAAISSHFAERHIEGRGMVLNVNDGDSVNRILEETAQIYSMPVILINNAGITKDNLLMRMSDQDWSAVIDTNLNSIFRLSKACLRAMTKAKWGRIINIGSIVSSMGNAGQCNYAAAKSGIAGFTRALAKEVGSRNITVNTVSPGFIDTEMTRVLPQEQKELMLKSIPLARLGKPEEIAAVVAFLASEASGYITGENIHVNGGMYMA
jgi:3-oxoacyl-[acyl-carrier protein] reductase